MTLCPCCGPDVSVDEDGCCATCGADATGPGVETVSRMIDCARQAQLTAEREHVASLASLAVEMAALREERDAALRGEYTERLRVTLQAERQSHDDTIALLRELRAALKSIVGRIDSGFVYRSVDAAIEVLLKRAEGI